MKKEETAMKSVFLKRAHVKCDGLMQGTGGFDGTSF